MRTMPATQLMTAEEFLTRTDLERGTELVAGELVMSAPSWRHQQVCVRLVHALGLWIGDRRDRGSAMIPIDVLLDEHNVYEPDVLWYSAARRPATRDPRPYPVPDIAVEVRSPSTWRYDVGVKKTEYERRGLPELWLVDLAADEVLVYRRSAPATPAFDISLELTAEDELASPLLPGFVLALDGLFAD